MLSFILQPAFQFDNELSDICCVHCAVYIFQVQVLTKVATFYLFCYELFKKKLMRLILMQSPLSIVPKPETNFLIGSASALLNDNRFQKIIRQIEVMKLCTFYTYTVYFCG